MGVGGQRHGPAALSPGMTRCPLYRRLGGPQGRAGLDRCGKSRPHRDSISGPSTLQQVAKATALTRSTQVMSGFGLFNDTTPTA